MVVWFRHGPCTVGVEDGVVRAQDFATLTSLLAAADSLEGERQRALAEARQEVDAMRIAAQEEIDAMKAEAREELERGYRDGLERGKQDAAAQWAETALRDAGSSRRSLERQTARLSNIVSLAVERVVEQEDRPALYRRALRTITKLLKDVPMLTLRVPEADRDSAQRAVDSVVQQLSTSMPIEVVTDAGLPQGSCLFESDQGVIDAGLDTQLAAIKRAVSRAAQHLALEGVVGAPVPELPDEDSLLWPDLRDPGDGLYGEAAPMGEEETAAHR
jgi:type III secretion protein L